MTNIRAKFYFEGVKTIRNHYGSEWKELVFRTQYDNTIPEDQRFQKATPTGVITMQVDNPAALEYFGQPGGYFYADFSPVPKPDSVS